MRKKAFSRILTAILSFGLIFSDMAEPLSVLASEEEVVSENSLSEDEAEEDETVSEDDMDTETVPVESISVSPKTLTLNVNETMPVLATVLPIGASNKKVTYTSSDETVASVDNSGVVKALKGGNTTITATTEDGGFSDTCEVTVKGSDVAVVAVMLSPERTTIHVNETVQLTATVIPTNATNKKVTYTSSDAAIASVSDNGLVTAIKEGKATITVTTDDGNKTASSEITVTSVPVAVSGVSVSPNSITMVTGEKNTLTPVITPSNATDKSVMFTSSDRNIVEVNDDGEVTALTEGEAAITITTVDGGFTTSCAVKVINSSDIIHVESVNITPSYFSLKVGAKETLSYTINPENATNKNVTWKSRNEDVATVDNKGVVVAISEGEAIIELRTEDGNKSAYSRVKVVSNVIPPIPDDPKPVPEEDPEADNGYESYDHLLEATEARDVYLVKGQKLNLHTTDISVSDKKTLGMSKPKNGYTTLTAKKPGTVTLTVPGEGGNTYTHTVHINTPSFAEKSIKLEINQSRDLSVNIGSGTDKYTVFYSSSNRDVAYVAKGKLYGLTKGAATIYAHINGKKYGVKVSVKDIAAPKSMDGITALTMQPLTSFTIKYNDGFKTKGAAWSVDGTAVTVTNGKITASNPGVSTVTGTDTNGQTRSFNVTVPVGVKQTIHISKGSGKNVKFNKLNGNKAKWYTNNASVVTVNNGKLKGVGAGAAAVSASYKGFTFLVNVIVEDPVLTTDDKLSAGKTYSLTINAGEIYGIQSSTISQRITWISSKPEVARVNNVGKVIATAPGTTKLTAKINGKTVSIKVTVR